VRVNGGAAWIVELNGQTVGYLLSPPVPGLPNYYSVNGTVLPEFRGQGLASRMLQETLAELSRNAKDPLRVVARVEQDDQPQIKFLCKNGFQLQHRDLHMVLDSLEHIRPVELDEGFRRIPFRPNYDEEKFVNFHRLAFEDQARFQPYSVEDVKAGQGDNFLPEDIILVESANRSPVGFVWTIVQGGRVIIEPLGVSPQWRGQGWGRKLLRMGLWYGRTRGATSAELWTGEDNQVSINLYLKEGFYFSGGYEIYYIDLDKEPR
jgi:ribosomal protein S18 acetylase RimI-like enzyme